MNVDLNSLIDYFVENYHLNRVNDTLLTNGLQMHLKGGDGHWFKVYGKILNLRGEEKDFGFDWQIPIFDDLTMSAILDEMTVKYAKTKPISKEAIDLAIKLGAKSIRVERTISGVIKELSLTEFKPAGLITDMLFLYPIENWQTLYKKFEENSYS